MIIGRFGGDGVKIRSGTQILYLSLSDSSSHRSIDHHEENLNVDINLKYLGLLEYSLVI